PGWVAAATWAHDRPEDRVVRMAAGIVADYGPDVLGHLVDAPEKVFDRLARPLGVLLERCVRVRHVGRVMLVVMDLHRFRVDVRLESVEPVRKRRKYKWHGGTLRLSEANCLLVNQ